MFNNRQKRDVERLSGRRGNVSDRAILWAELKTLASEIGAFVASPSYASKIVKNTPQEEMDDHPSIRDVNQLIDTANTFIQNEASRLDDADTDLQQQLDTVSADLGEAEASVTQNASAIATVESYQAASYTLRVAAGGAEGTLEFVAADDPINGPASGLRISVDMVDIEGQLNADWITSGFIRASQIEVDDLLSLDASRAGFSIEKTSAYDIEIDGIYMGRTQELDGSVGFGLSFSKTDDTTGFRQSMEATKENGLRVVNGTFYRLLSAPYAPGYYTADQTVDLGSGRLNFLIMGGGGGGGGGQGNGGGPYPGNPGGDTVVVLKDGTTTIETWTASGGDGAPAGFNSYNLSGERGEGSAWGTGGSGGRRYEVIRSGDGGESGSITTTVIQATPGGDGGGFGAGGGGGGDNYYPIYSGLGGKAGDFIAVTGYDISGLTDPKLEITIGAGGAGAGGALPGGDGAPGQVQVADSNYTNTRADVIPLTPTFTGTINADGPFPDYGAGLWVIQGTSPTGGHTEIDAGGATIDFLYATNSSSSLNATTFVSSKTPVVVNPSGAAVTMAYRFYKMGD